MDKQRYSIHSGSARVFLLVSVFSSGSALRLDRPARTLEVDTWKSRKGQVFFALEIPAGFIPCRVLELLKPRGAFSRVFRENVFAQKRCKMNRRIGRHLLT
ncbi:MAG TPA: hypothetical protein VF458_00190 [Ktedonobacteraceae bacterium]